MSAAQALRGTLASTNTRLAKTNVLKLFLTCRDLYLGGRSAYLVSLMIWKPFVCVSCAVPSEGKKSSRWGNNDRTKNIKCRRKNLWKKKKNLFDNISDGKVIFYPLIQAVTFVLLYDFMRCNKLFCFLFVLFFISFYGITKRNGNQKHIIFWRWKNNTFWQSSKAVK